jgi:hypothetical protein
MLQVITENSKSVMSVLHYEVGIDLVEARNSISLLLPGSRMPSDFANLSQIFGT